MSLLELEIGQEARISEIQIGHFKKDRFNGLGIIKKTNIKTIKKGWGIKLYEVRGTTIAIRNEDASKIIIDIKI